MVHNLKSHFKPDFVSFPGKTLQETIDNLGITQRGLAKRTGLTPKHINEIINGIAPITPETALKLERTTSVPASFWNNYESKYREVLARIADRQRINTPEINEWLKKIPVQKMIEYKWIPNVKSAYEKVDALLNFFGMSSFNNMQRVWADLETKFRMSTTRPINRWAIAAWLRRGIIQAQKKDCNPFDKAKLLDALCNIRNLTVHRDPDIFTPKIKSVCSNCGVVFMFVRELPKTGISGASYWFGRDKAVIQLSLRYKTNDQIWFSFFHEAAHILKHKKSCIYINTFDIEDKSTEEEQANIFASNFLIPKEKYKEFKCKSKFSKATIKCFAKELGIHPGIVVGRLQHDKLIEFKYCNDLKDYLEW